MYQRSSHRVLGYIFGVIIYYERLADGFAKFFFFFFFFKVKDNGEKRERERIISKSNQIFH